MGLLGYLQIDQAHRTGCTRLEHMQAWAFSSFLSPPTSTWSTHGMVGMVAVVVARLLDILFSFLHGTCIFLASLHLYALFSTSLCSNDLCRIPPFALDKAHLRSMRLTDGSKSIRGPVYTRVPVVHIDMLSLSTLFFFFFFLPSLPFFKCEICG